MNRLYYIIMYRKDSQASEYIEAKNLMEALRDFNLLHDCTGYESLIIRRIYRQIQLRHTMEQKAYETRKRINLLKTKQYE